MRAISHRGKLRALGTASPTRIEPLPDTPAVAESG
jgi:tripartite-type tricarboxylate transporter receptor subunit TctC